MTSAPISGTAARILAFIARVERVLAFVAFATMVAVVFIDVCAREVTGRGVVWALQSGVYANFVLVMVSLGLASSDGAHLRPGFADRWLPASWSSAIATLGEWLTALFCAGACAVAAIVVAETYVLDERSPVLGNPVWPLQALMPAVLGVAAIRHALFAAIPALRPTPPGSGLA